MGKLVETDPVKSARSAGLRYVNDTMPGLRRVTKGNSFVYTGFKGKLITEEKTLDRIKSLVIPPAWRDVWICIQPNGHLQATGYDAKNRKQYKYHPQWNTDRNLTKFSKLKEFGAWLPGIRKQVEEDLDRKIIDREKVIAAVIMLMEKSCMRIGNREYAIKNQSFGLTTLRDRHVKIEGTKMFFEFRGKKGIIHKVELQDQRLARIVKHCKEIPGYELFQFLDENGIKHSIESGDVNSYLQTITGQEFSAKDYRTWAGTLHAFRALRDFIETENKQEIKSQIVDAIKEVSKKLGNTPAVCRKYYIHPLLLQTFEDGRLEKFISRFRRKRAKEDQNFYDEKMLLMFLELDKT